MVERYTRRYGDGSRRERLSIDDYKNIRDTQKLLNALEGFERDKTQEQIELAEFAIDLVNKVLVEYGYESEDVALDEIHVVTNGTNFSSDALYDIKSGHIVINESYTRTQFLTNLIHELLHKFSYHAYLRADKIVINERLGFRGISRNGDRFGEGLNEAIVEMLTKEIISNFGALEHPLLAEESSETQKNIEESRSQIQQLLPDTVSLSDVYQVSAGNIFCYGYEHYRKIVTYLCEELYKRNRELFESVEDVQKLFYKAEFSGNLMEVGRLVDGTFGAGTLRRLSSVENTQESADEFIRSLQ